MSSTLVLVLNGGSSSLKFAIINPDTGETPLSGLAECFYLPEARIKWEKGSKKHKASLDAGATHTEALNFIVNRILSEETELASQLSAIGHRIVHGGKIFTESVIITDEVIEGIQKAIPFAPLHNPAHLTGISAARQFFPQLADKNVAVFDTAFHQTMPEASYLYALPYEYYRDHDIRRYGAHGTSHFYVSRQAARFLGKPAEKLNAISCHLGNGCSVTAIRDGKSVDTSMGLTPLEGLVMGTRSGDLDPAIIFYLHRQFSMDIDKIEEVLSKKSGLLGLTEVSSDCRYVEDHYDDPEKPEARRAMDVFCHRLAKYIAAYTSLMEGRLDLVIFTGGIGENSALVRELTLSKLSLSGFQVDPERNLSARFGQSGTITKDDSRLVMVIPTNEERVIAQDTARLTRF